MLELAGLRERVAQQDRLIGEKAARLADAQAERDHWRMLAEQATAALAERRQPRPWPGLKAWLRRAWDGSEG